MLNKKPSMYVLKPRTVEFSIQVHEPVVLDMPSKHREDPLDEDTLVKALDSIERARNRLKTANKELDRLERRWKKLTEHD